MRVDLAIQADSLLRASGGVNLVRLRYAAGEVFEPFKAVKLWRRLTGPVPKGGRCSRCCGPRRSHELLCRACTQPARLFPVDYWQKLWSRQEPDFAPELLDLIAEHERELGSPAAHRPPLESTITFEKCACKA